MSELLTIVEPNKRAPRRDSRDWTETLEVLKANPGDFVLIAKNEKHRQLAATIKAGKNKAFAAGDFDATSQKASEGEGYDILASYIGAEAVTEATPVEEPVAEVAEPAAEPLVESAAPAEPVAVAEGNDFDDWS